MRSIVSRVGSLQFDLHEMQTICIVVGRALIGFVEGEPSFGQTLGIAFVKVLSDHLVQKLCVIFHKII